MTQPKTHKPELVREIFHEAYSIADKKKQLSHIESAAGGDPRVVQEVTELLQAAHDHQGSADFTISPELLAPLVEPVDAAVGTTLGSYRVNSTIATSRLCAVYRAKRIDGLYDKEVCIKVEVPTKKGPRAHSIAEEIRILGSLDHEFVGGLLDAGKTDDDRHYLIMELVDGKDLLRYCDEHRLSVRARLSLFLKVCEAVEYVHSLGILHCDLKPQNILVTSRGQPKLVDFGSARPVLPPASEPRQLSLTPSYASPEQIRLQRLGFHSDVFSLGTVLYELLAGLRPFHYAGRLLHRIVAATCDETPDPPSDVLNIGKDQPNAGITREQLDTIARHRSSTRSDLQARLVGDVDAIVMSCLRKEPGQRYPSVRHLSQDIRAYLAGDKPAISQMNLAKTGDSAELPSVGWPLRVFLCYGKEDKEAARELYRLLKQLHLRPWLDEEDLLPGQDWQKEIAKSVRDSDVVLVCLSEDSTSRRGFLRREMKYALDTAEEQPDSSIYIIPVRLDDCDLPDDLRRWQWVDMFGARGKERLLSGLKVKAEERKRAGEIRHDRTETRGGADHD